MTITIKFKPGDLVWSIIENRVDCQPAGGIKAHLLSNGKVRVQYIITDCNGENSWVDEQCLYPSLEELCNSIMAQGAEIMQDEWYRDEVRKAKERKEIQEINEALNSSDPVPGCPLSLDHKVMTERGMRTLGELMAEQRDPWPGHHPGGDMPM